MSGAKYCLALAVLILLDRAGSTALAGKITSKTSFSFITRDGLGLWTWDLDSHLADPRGYQTPHGRWACPPARPPKTQKTAFKANQKLWWVGTLTIGKGTKDSRGLDPSHLLGRKGGGRRAEKVVFYTCRYTFGPISRYRIVHYSCAFAQ